MILDYFESFSKRFSYEKSADEYLSTILEFINIIQKEDEKEIKEEDAQKFINHQVNNFKLSTAEKKITHMRSYFRYIVKENGIKISPFAYLEVPRTDKKVKNKNVLSPDEIRLAIENLSKLNPVKQLMIYMFLTTGLSVSEIQEIRWRDLIADDTDNLFLIAGKEQKRIIKLHRDILDLVVSVRKFYSLESEIEPTDEHIFVQRKRMKKYSLRTIKRSVKDYLESIGIEDISSKDLRHTFVSYALIYGSSVKEVRNQIGLRSELSMIRYNDVLDHIDSRAVRSIEECGIFDINKR